MDYQNSSEIDPEELNPKIRKMIDHVVSKVNFGMVYDIYTSYFPDDDLELDVESLKEDLIITLRLALYWGYDMFDDQLWVIIIEYTEDELDIEKIRIFFRPMLYELHTGHGELNNLFRPEQNQIDILTDKLNTLVAEENYKEAAKVRDMIKELKLNADSSR